MLKGRKSKRIINDLSPKDVIDQEEQKTRSADCIIKQGYLVKSPPTEKIKNKIARWHLRWFVLYDNFCLCRKNEKLERQVELCYYKNHDSFKNMEQPKGAINLIGVEIYPLGFSLHGYPFVINICTKKRIYHLCATQIRIHRQWVVSLKGHYIALKQMKQRYHSKKTMNDDKYDPVFSNATEFFEFKLKTEMIKQNAENHYDTGYLSDNAVNYRDSWYATLGYPLQFDDTFDEENMFERKETGLFLKNRNHNRVKKIKLKPTLSLFPSSLLGDLTMTSEAMTSENENEKKATKLQTYKSKREQKEDWKKLKNADKLLSDNKDKGNVSIDLLKEITYPNTGRKTKYILNDLSNNDVIGQDGSNYYTVESIIKQGYLVKSPPTEKIKNKMARWHLRWFVLYDNSCLCTKNDKLERQIELCYYKNHDSFKNMEQPKGAIDLIGAEIYPLGFSLHGFPFVINICTKKRTYHLCATQKRIHKEWVESLKGHYVSLNQIHQRYHSNGTLNGDENDNIDPVFTKATDFLEFKLKTEMEKQNAENDAKDQDDDGNLTDHTVNRRDSWFATLSYPLQFDDTFDEENLFERTDTGLFLRNQNNNKSNRLKLKPTFSLYPSSLLGDLTITCDEQNEKEVSKLEVIIDEEPEENKSNQQQKEDQTKLENTDEKLSDIKDKENVSMNMLKENIKESNTGLSTPEDILMDDSLILAEEKKVEKVLENLANELERGCSSANSDMWKAWRKSERSEKEVFEGDVKYINIDTPDIVELPDDENDDVFLNSRVDFDLSDISELPGEYVILKHEKQNKSPKLSRDTNTVELNETSGNEVIRNKKKPNKPPRVKYNKINETVKENNYVELPATSLQESPKLPQKTQNLSQDTSELPQETPKLPQKSPKLVHVTPEIMLRENFEDSIKDNSIEKNTLENKNSTGKPKLPLRRYSAPIIENSLTLKITQNKEKDTKQIQNETRKYLINETEFLTPCTASNNKIISKEPKQFKKQFNRQRSPVKYGKNFFLPEVPKPPTLDENNTTSSENNIKSLESQKNNEKPILPIRNMNRCNENLTSDFEVVVEEFNELSDIFPRKVLLQEQAEDAEDFERQKSLGITNEEYNELSNDLPRTFPREVLLQESAEEIEIYERQKSLRRSDSSDSNTSTNSLSTAFDEILKRSKTVDSSWELGGWCTFEGPKYDRRKSCPIDHL